MKVQIYDWHGSASQKLEEVGYKANAFYTLTPEQICALAEHFSVMIRKVEGSTEADYLVAVTIHRNFGQR